MGVRVRYWASARDAAGTAEDVVDAADVREALARATERHGEQLARIVALSTIVVDGRRTGPQGSVAVGDGSVVEIMPPFAGG